MKAIYPFVGGTAESHRWNLKNTSQYKIDFMGGGNHTANGYIPNGTTAYARTNFVDTNLSVNSVSYSIYNRTITPTTKDLIDFGYFKLNSGYISNLFSTYYGGTYGGRVNSWNAVSLPQTNPQGFYNGNRTNSTDFNFFKNGTKIMTASDNTAGKLQTGYQFHLGCLFIDGQYYDNFTTNNYAFAHIGDGLTDTEATAFYNAVQAYQVTLGRQI